MDPDTLTVDDLAPVDKFHIRGRTATEELIQWAQVRADHLLLDVGVPQDPGLGVEFDEKELAQLTVG